MLFVRRFKLIFMGKKDSVPEILQGGLLVQSPVKGLAKEMKVSRDKLRLKGGFDVKKRKKRIWTTQKSYLKFKTILNLMKIQAKATEHVMLK